MTVRYTCPASTGTLLQLEKCAHDAWEDVKLLGPVARLGNLVYRANGVQIVGPNSLTIMAVSVDVAEKLEVFRLTAAGVSQDSKRFDPLGPECEPEELFWTFRQRGRRIIVVTRAHTTASGPDTEGMTFEVDDLLILRDAGGQQAFVVADEEQPGAILVTRVQSEIPDNGATIVAMRYL